MEKHHFLSGFFEPFATETVKDQGTLCPIKLILHFCRPQFTETPLESTFNEGLVASRSDMVGQFWTEWARPSPWLTWVISHVPMFHITQPWSVLMVY